MHRDRSDHLLLLIGSNPLPNAVAGKLLADCNGTITLICSEDSFQVAQRLKDWLSAQGLKKIDIKKVGESDPHNIFKSVREALNNNPAEQVGLNYTGGTKAMSVHAYRAMEHWANEQRDKGQQIETVFSYLDARTLQMIIDPTNSGSVQREYVGMCLTLQLTDLLALHGWTLNKQPVTDPLLRESGRALAQLWADDSAKENWTQWLESELEKNARNKKNEWISDKELRDLSLNWMSHEPGDLLSKFVDTFTSETNSRDSNNVDFTAKPFAKPKHLCEWLHGKWLEHYLLDLLNSLKETSHLHECKQNIVPAEVEFDLDVIAMRGYQLFAFSCSTDKRLGLLKEKLFEASQRARQLGGDEACVALVCCSDDPDRVQQEMRHIFNQTSADRITKDSERIKVFGRKHLVGLAEHISDWIKQQSKES